MPFYLIRFFNNITGRYCGDCGICPFDGYKEKRPKYINRGYETHAYVRVVNYYCGLIVNDNIVLLCFMQQSHENFQKHNVAVKK